MLCRGAGTRHVPSELFPLRLECLVSHANRGATGSDDCVRKDWPGIDRESGRCARLPRRAGRGIAAFGGVGSLQAVDFRVVEIDFSWITVAVPVFEDDMM